MSELRKTLDEICTETEQYEERLAVAMREFPDAEGVIMILNLRDELDEFRENTIDKIEPYEEDADDDLKEDFLCSICLMVDNVYNNLDYAIYVLESAVENDEYTKGKAFTIGECVSASHRLLVQLSATVFKLQRLIDDYEIFEE